jgi:DNA-binding NarL/FixJ family response regulator
MQNLLRILIVDDQPRARSSLKALLSTWPQAGEMHEASNGREAVQLVGELRPDVVLMDVEHQDGALAAGADAYVSKGEAPEKLLDVVSAVIKEGS